MVSHVSNNPTMINLGYQRIFKKIIIKLKTSCVPFDIHELKLTIIE
jgi:hypothetical protein